jgi:hypothetical protein
MPALRACRDSLVIRTIGAMTMHSKTLLGTAFAAALIAFGGGAQAQYTAIVSTAPPPPRHEVAPSAREGHVWAPGHYEYRGNEYVWIEGHWMRDRSGYEYREPRWVQRADGSWYLVGGNWERRMAEREARREARQYARNHPEGDFDRDGIANRYDRDIDGDGVPNRRDAAPYNPRRS